MCFRDVINIIFFKENLVENISCLVLHVLVQQLYVINHLSLQTNISVFANSADQDETACNDYCLSFDF